jgi:hypothetical protein
MTWKLYALSGGAFLATYAMSLVAPLDRDRVAPPSAMQVPGASQALVDLSAQAERLRVRIEDVTSYTEPTRNAFRFGTVPPPSRPFAPPPVQAAEAIPPAVLAPPRPPFALAGMATTVDAGVSSRTAILTSLAGVALVEEGDLVEGGYRVRAIADDAVTLESTRDGTVTTLRLSGSDER